MKNNKDLVSDLLKVKEINGLIKPSLSFSEFIRSFKEIKKENGDFSYDLVLQNEPNQLDFTIPVTFEPARLLEIAHVLDEEYVLKEDSDNLINSDEQIEFYTSLYSTYQYIYREAIRTLDVLRREALRSSSDSKAYPVYF